MQTETPTFQLVSLSTDLEQAYFEYAVETITDRALPRVEDGLKPVQRRILFTMHEMGLYHDKPYKKSARVVGDCLGKYHPHGDASIYMAMIRMGQDFSMRHPLVDGQGNWGCFTGETKIKLLDGTERSFEELARMYKPGEVFYVYSVDDQGNVVVGEGHDSRVTRRKATVIELQLDNGEIIRCTPDHRFMLRDGSYKQARDLTENDSLMPGYLSTAPVREGLNEYLTILNPATGTYEFVHHLADQYNSRRATPGITTGPFVRHHKDFNRWNNNPTNIERMRFMDHLRLHAAQVKELWTDDAFRELQRKGVLRYYAEHPEAQESNRDRLRARNVSEKFRQENGPRVSAAQKRLHKEHPQLGERISRRMKALWADPDFRKEMSEALRKAQKRPLSEEQREHVAQIIAHKSRLMWQDPEKRAEIVQAIRSAMAAPETRARLSRSTRALWQDPEYRAKFADDHFSRMAHAFWEKPDSREFHRDKIQKQWTDADFAARQRAGVQASNARRMEADPDMMIKLTDRAAESLREKWQDDSYRSQVVRNRILFYGSYLLSRYQAEEITPELYDQLRYNNAFPRFEKAMSYFASFEEFLELSANYNHRIVAKRTVTGQFDVYDITVEHYHNFLLDAGVFVHNSIDGDPPAAMRYTEARLAEIAAYMLQDIEQNTVDFVDNFDGSLQEPVILPAALPNLLVNGATGIAVGMATNIPPHNLGEVCDALVYVAERWQARAKIGVDELLKIVPGPDFPTGGVIYRYRDDPLTGQKLDTIREAYAEGRSRIVTQARVGLEEIGGGKVNIVVTELPYAVQKSTVLERIAREVRDGRIAGVTDLRDESDHEGMRAVIEVSRVANPREVLESVLQRSQLRETFGVNALALVPERTNGETVVRPQRLSLKDMLVYFVEHRLTVIVRRSKYELEKRQARLHIVEGLLKALDVIDEVIDTIRRSRTAETAEANLIKKFGFTQLQAQAILSMQLRRLAALERRKLADEEKELRERIKYLQALLRSEKKRLQVVVEETRALKEQFATPRKTVILTDEKPGDSIVTEADLAVPDGPQVLVVTTQGFERHDAKGFGYRVKPGTTGRAVEAHRRHLVTEPSDVVVLVSSRGRAWWGPVGRLPRAAGSGELGLDASKGEQVVGMSVLADDCCLVIGTRQGQVKRVKASDVRSSSEASWSTIVGLAGEDDGVLFAGTGGDKAEAMFLSSSRAIRFAVGDVNPQATPSARGVAAIKLRAGDRLLGGALIPDPRAKVGVVVVHQGGQAKWVPLAAFPVQGRGGQGVVLGQTKATGPVVAVAVGPLNGAVDLIGADGKRQRLGKIPVGDREKRGAKVVELDKVAEAWVV
jgi:DNA gyrase subunit A